MNDSTSHQSTLTDTNRAALNQVKGAAHEVYLSACRILAVLDETADPVWVSRAETVRDRAWELYRDLILETEW